MLSKTDFVRPHKTRIALSLALLITLAVCATSLIRIQTQSPEQMLRDGWTLAEQSGRYRFTSQVTQTTLPAPRRANVGQTVREDHLVAQGDVDRHANTVQLLLWDNLASASDPKQALEVNIRDGQASGRVKGGEWKKLDTFDDVLAPGGDVAAYLVAARHVTDLGVEQRNVPTLSEPFLSHRYHFVIDGTALSAYLTEQLEAELRKKGELPPGLTLGIGEGFRQIAGSGEVWLDAYGLPLRLQADIEFPEQRTGERVLVHVQTDFTNFDRSQLFLNTMQVAGHLQAMVYRVQQSFDGLLVGIGLVTITLAVAAVIALQRMPARRAHTCVASALLVVMGMGQIAQAKPYTMPASLRGRLAPPKNSDGQKPPPEPAPSVNAPSQIAPQDQTLISLPGRYSMSINKAAADPATGPDADRDGLPDSLEPTWRTDLNNPDSDGDGLIDGEEVRRCPDLTSALTGLTSGNLLQGKNATWPGCANPKQPDTDGDGLTDNQEAIFLGTNPNARDTDGDGLSDFVEVRGFVIGGNPPVYSNALNADTDGDGLLDGIECPSQPCQDSDSDGQLDFNDLDNDNDGFIGSFDNAPFSALGKVTPFTRNNPLLLNVQNLNAGKSVFVDFQVRPTNANHIGYGQSVLDWPSGDIEGQIQRRLDTTFASVNPMPVGMSSPNNDPQHNGDMRLVPVLEIEMNGSRAPLPRTTAVQTITVQSAPLLAVIQIMTESEAIEVFGFTASEKQDLRIRVTALNADYSNYSLEIYQGSCFAGLTTPQYTANNLIVNGETTFPNAKQSVIADGGHVALLKANGLSPQCLPIPETVAEASYVPLNFELPINKLGTITLKQAGSNVQVNSNLSALTGSHTMAIYAGNCQARQSLVTQFQVNAVGSFTLNGLRVVDLADGNHALFVYQGNRVLTCSELGNVVNGVSTESEMIDPAAMDKLSITVSEADAAGTLIAHVPLNVAYDAKTGITGGFAGTMLYDRTAATQWSNHKVRMSWWVQVLTDLCTTPPADFMAGQNEQARQTSWCGANANQTRLVHAYDESWQLASLSVREEQNFDMDIVYEDPSSDPVKNGDAYLWDLAQGLDEQFVTGVDCVRATQAAACTKDGQRDYTLNTIYNTFHKDVNGGVSSVNRWGIPQTTFRVEKLDTQLNTFLDQGLVMQKYVPDVLNSRFLASGKSVVDAPLFLFASESSFRHVALGEAAYASATANSATIDFHPANNDAQPVKTIASLSWAPYRYNAIGKSWEAYPFEEYWDLLAIRLKSSGAINTGNDEGSRAVTNGKVRIAQTYFAYLYGGRAGLVQSDNLAIGQWDINAGNFVSRDERQLRILDAGELAEAIGDGSLINLVLEPLIESLVENLESYRFQQAVIKADKIALLQRTLEITGDNDNTTRTNFLKSVGGDTKEALTENFFKNFKPNSLSHVGGRVTSGIAVGLVFGSLAAGIAAGINASGQEGADGLLVARNVLYGVSLAKEIIGAVGMLATASKAVEEAGATGLKAFAAVRDALSETTKAERIAGVVGLAVGELFNYSFLIAQLAINHLTPGELAANKLAAQSIATSAYSGMMFALASTGIGAIIVAIIGLIDGVIFLACGFLDDEQTESVPGQVICQGISGWLTQVISFGIYAQNEITRVNDPHRLSYLNYQPSLTDPTTGFRANAGLSLALKIRNTLRLAHLPVNIGILYGWQYSNDTLQSARFAYDIVSAKPAEGIAELHASITRSSGPNPWLPLETNSGGGVVSFYADQALNSGGKLALPQQAGLNQKVSALLAEGYAVPVQECINTATFLFPLPPIVACWVRSRGETNYNDLNLVYDVLPATLDDFYALTITGDKPGQYRQTWSNNANLPFPGLIDADGDGLRYDSDADDSRWDTDGDGTSDAVELSRKTNPSNSDSDSDGLSDRREQIWGSNPIVADTDGDGVNDGDEIAGWSIGYGSDNTGVALTSWTFSDPTERDMDSDSILDAKEKVYGFNPNLANESTALRYDARVIETKAPLLLTRFDESGNATTFADSSTDSVANNATCVTGKCPVAGVRGRFGNAVFLNGIDQYLISAPNVAIGNLRSNITLSAWVKPSKLSGKQSVIQIGPGGPNGIGGLTFGLQDTGLYMQYEGGKGNFTQPLPAGTIPLNQWSYIAVELYRVSDAVHQLYFYANSNIERGVVAGLQKEISANPEIVIGAAQQPAANVPPNKDGSLATIRTDYFAGAIDEVLIQGWVPINNSSISALMAGRYNPDDALLRQNEDAIYASHLENALMTRTIAGQRSIQYPATLTNQPSTQTPFKLEPARSQEYTDMFTVTATTASGRYSLTQSVSGIVSVPARDVWKDPASNKAYEWLGPQLYVGTSNTVSDGSQPVDLNNKSFTIAAWVKPINGDTARRGILGRNSGQNDAFPYLLTQGTQLKFGFGTGSGNLEVTANDGDTSVLALNEWNYVAVRYDVTTRNVTFFVNTVKLNTVATGVIPNSPDWTFLIGRASNLGKLNLTQMTLMCEGDGIGDGEYDLIHDGTNIWQGTGSEITNWPLNINQSFNDNYLLTLCEDDNGINNDCGSGDRDMGSLYFSTDIASFTSAATYGYPQGSTVCAYDWGRVLWPDIATITYTFNNDSLPFIGELRDIEIHTAALGDSEILNIGSHGDKVAQFRLDEFPSATSFNDAIAYHLLSCVAPTCPQTGVAGKQNLSAYFDGVDDHLVEDGAQADYTGTDISSNSSGFGLSLWIKPAIAVPPIGAGGLINIASWKAPIGGSPRGDLNLVHATNGYVLAYKDQTVGVELFRCQPGVGQVYGYGEWHHLSLNVDRASKRVSLYVDAVLCNSIVVSSQTPYVPILNDSLELGHSNDIQTFHYTGNIDDVNIHRKALTQQEVFALYRQGEFQHWNLDGALGDPNNRVNGLLGGALKFGELADRVVLDPGPTNQYDGDLDSNPSTPNPMTFAMWVNAENTANRILPLLAIRSTIDQHLDMVLFLNNGIPNISYRQSNTGSNQIGSADKKISDNVWQHLVFRKDDSGGMSIFINGYKASNIPGNWDLSDVRGASEGFVLGGDRTGGTLDDVTNGRFFNGRIDEVIVYRAALTDQEIRELYNYQNAWVDEKVSSEITVDADLPNADLPLKSAYFANAPQLLQIVADDATSKISNAQLGINAGSGVTWVGASADPSDVEGNTWIPLFTPSGEGAYTLSAQATDSVGNSGAPSADQTVYVDGTAPNITFNAVANLVRPTASGNDAAVWYLDLAGASFDPNIANTNQPGSGRAAIDVTLSNSNGEAATLFTTQRATLIPNTDSWTIRYKINAANPTGEYQINAVAIDNVGNRRSANPIKIKIDTTAPQSHVTILNSPTYQQAVAMAYTAQRTANGSLGPNALNAAYPEWLDGQSTIGGVVTENPADVVAQRATAGVAGVEVAFAPLFAYGSALRNQPLPAATLLYLPLDESSRTANPDQQFADVSPAKRSPFICANASCPLAGTPGRSGQALDFDGINDSILLSNTAALNGLTSDFTVAAWIKPKTVAGFQRIVSTARSNSDNGYGLGIAEGHLLFTTYGVKDYFTTKVVLNAGAWQHVAVRLNASNAAEFYLNGLLIETIAGSAPATADGDDRLLVGATSESGNAATSQHFNGLIDEVVILRGFLTSADWETILGVGPTLHFNFDEPLINPNITLANNSGLVIENAAYRSVNLSADQNLHAVGKVGPGALSVSETSGAFRGESGLGTLPDKNGALSMAQWVKLADATSQMTFWIGQVSGTQNRIVIKPNSIALQFTGQADLNVGTTSLIGAWHHVAVSYDGSRRILYLDGLEIGRDTITPNTLNTLLGGTFVVSGTGAVDDVRVYRYALNPQETKALASMGWQTTNTINAAGGISETTWSATVPVGLEGLYELQSRGIDKLGNVSNEPRELVTWRGTIDSLAPRLLTFTANKNGDGTTYAITVEDFDLATNSVEMPLVCTSNNTTTVAKRYESPWYLALAEQVSNAGQAAQVRSRAYQLSILCHASTTATTGRFRVCDIAGNCTDVDLGPQNRRIYFPIVNKT